MRNDDERRDAVDGVVEFVVYFGDMIRKETGKSAQEHLQQKMLDTAKQLLTSSDKNITEIAYALGFQYPQYFSRAFKNLEGCTPGKYRAAVR